MMTITNKTSGETIALARDVCAVHPEWVHAQLETRSEGELQDALSQYHVEEFFDSDGHHLGPDECGISLA